MPWVKRVKAGEPEASRRRAVSRDGLCWSSGDDEMSPSGEVQVPAVQPQCPGQLRRGQTCQSRCASPNRTRLGP